MLSPARFGPVGCAMVTPFGPDGGLDLDVAVELAQWLVDHGNDFLVLSGTTGESPTLDDDEKLALWKAVCGEVAVPVLAGTSSADTAHSARLTAKAAEAGVAGILAVTPYYNRPPQAGVAAHMRELSRAAQGLPVILYDIPVRTGRKVAEAIIVALAQEGVIAGLKDAAGNPAATAALIAQCPSGFEVYSGNDSDTLPLLAVGAVGTVSVESHWAGELVKDMIAAVSKGDLEAARAANARLIPSHRFQSSDEAPNPIPAKAAMRALGLRVGYCRAPMVPEPPGLEDQARSLLAELGHLSL